MGEIETNPKLYEFPRDAFEDVVKVPEGSSGFYRGSRTSAGGWVYHGRVEIDEDEWHFAVHLVRLNPGEWCVEWVAVDKPLRGPGHP